LEETARTLPERQLRLLEALLRIPAGSLQATLSHVSDLIASATGADKIDAFLYDKARDSLVAVGTSTQPLSALQRQLGLDVLPLSNGGQTVNVFRTGETYYNGRVDQDADEVLGIKEALAVRSEIGVPLDLGGERRGMLMVASQQPEFFTPEDVRFLEAVGHWVGIVAHRAELAEVIGRNAVEQGRRTAAEELVTVLAHDLRNYLSPLDMRLQLLATRAKRDGRADDARDVESARRSVTRLGGLVADILDVARIDQGVFQMEPEPVDLGMLVQETVSLLATPEHPVLLRVQDGGSITVAADAGRLRQCLENIVSNAIQKSPAKAAVTVFVSKNELRANVDVVDEGPGIPADILPHVFERFVSGSRREGGLGLGLYLAKRIAAVHGGDLTVESPPGKGARFTLTLPVAPGTGAARPEAP
jgi:two-component system OmpR family sensor kinase